MKTLRVEGWRFIPHSYAIVNQWQLLSLLKRNDVALNTRDLPYFNRYWNSARGLFTAEQEHALSSIPAATGDTADATYRIAFPYEFSVPEKNRTVVFATSELKCFEDSYFKSSPDIKRLTASQLFAVVTPSHWSREGFLRLGLREEQVIVIPHGIDPDCFSRPTEQTRRGLRSSQGISGFVFANASLMTGNKGIDLLLRAFAAVAEKCPDTRLHLKGTDRLYRSKALLSEAVATLPVNRRSLVVDRLFYFGDTISNKQMAEFYQLSDVYISPYRAEGFNLPVLEASACGTPVICTKGGPTDDFMKPTFAQFIDAKLVPIRVAGTQSEGVCLAPDVDHLVHLMFKVMDDKNWREQASAAGEQNAAIHFNWDGIVHNLLDAVFSYSRSN
jgi:glycosyltransferase involved in cell wall biosynthesis